MTSSPKYTLQLINQQGAVEQTVHLEPGAAPAQKRALLRGQTGMRFNLFDEESLVGPPKFLARRDGYDLQIFLDGNTVTAANAATSEPDVTITDYYGTCAASELTVSETVGVDSCNFFSGQEGSNFKYVPEHGGRVMAMGWLEPGDASAFVVSPIAGVAPAGVVGLGGWALLAGAGLGIAGLAAAAGNDSNKVPLAVPNDITVTDDVGPVTGAIEPGMSTDDSRPTWTGRAGSTGPGFTVTLFDGSTAIGSAVAGPDGAWSITPTTPLAEGPHTITVAVADKEGNTSPQGKPLEFVVDTTPPATPTVAGNVWDDAGPVTGIVAPGGTTDDPTPGLVVPTAPTGSDHVELVVDGTVVPSTYDPTTRLLTPTKPLTDGPHTVGYQVVDAAGNRSGTSPTVPFKLEAGIKAGLGYITTDTGVSVNDFITSDTTLVIGGKATNAPAGSKVEVALDSGKGFVVVGTVSPGSDGSWSVDHTGTSLADGNYQLRTRVIDASGVVVGTAETQKLTIDTSSANPGTPGPDNPAANVTSALGSITDDTGVSSTDFVTSDTTLVVHGTSANTGAGYHVKVQIDRNDGKGFVDAGYATTRADGSWDFDYTKMVLPDGVYTLRSAITDIAGNAVPGSVNDHPLVIDTAGVNVGPGGPNNPAANVGSAVGSITDDTGASSTDFVTSDTTLVVHGTSANTGAGYHIELLIDKNDGKGFVPFGRTETRADGSWDIDNRATALPAGHYVLKSQVVDLAGNPVPNSINTHDLVIDTSGDNGGPNGPNNPAANATSSIGSITEDTGPSRTDFVTSDTTLVIHGTSANTGAGYHVAVSIDDGDGRGFHVIGQATTRADGSWDLDYTSTPIAAGTHTLRSQITDLAGNPVAGSTNDHSLVVDTTDTNTGPKGPNNPDANVTSLLGSITDDTGPSSTDFVTSDRTLVIHGSSANTGAGYHVQLAIDRNDGRGFVELGYATTRADGSWDYDATGTSLADGNYVLRSAITDLAGVAVAHSLNTHALVIDSSGTNPGTPGPENPAPTTAATITAISDDTGASSTDFVTTDTTLIFRGAINVAAAGYHVRLELQSGATTTSLGYATTTADGQWAFDYRGTPLAAGSYTLRAVVTDLAGNPTSGAPVASQAIVIDVTPVDAPSGLDLPAAFDSGSANDDNITNLPSVSIAGKGLKGATVTLFDVADPSKPLGTAVVDANGDFTVTHVTLADGVHQLKAVQTSDAGVASAQASAPLTVTIDRSLPSAPTIDLGGYVAVWRSIGSGAGHFGIVGQRYDNANGLIGSEFVVNPTPTNIGDESITALGNGGFVVTWANTDAGDPNIHARVYNSAGLAITSEFTVNNLVAGDQGETHVSALPNGGFVVTWTSFGLDDGMVSAVYARMYDALGTPTTTTEFRVTPTQPSASHSDIAVLGDGSFVVTWDSTEPGGDGRGIYGQRYSASGAAVGSAFHVNTSTTNEQSQAAIAPLAGNGYVVVWASNQNPIGDSRFDLFMQRYDGSGNRAGVETKINANGNSNTLPDITVLADGSFVVVWTAPDANLSGVYAKHYGADGAVLQGEFLVNTYQNNYQSHPSVQALADGGFVVTWDSLSQVGAGSQLDIYSQRFSATMTRVGAETLLNSTTNGSQELPRLATLNTELADHALSATEAADGTLVRVNITSKGVQALDTVSVDWGNQHIERALTGDEIASGYAMVAVSAAQLVAAGAGPVTVKSHLTDRAGNVGADSAVETIQVTLPSGLRKESAATDDAHVDAHVDASASSGDSSASASAGVGATDASAHTLTLGAAAVNEVVNLHLTSEQAVTVGVVDGRAVSLEGVTTLVLTGDHVVLDLAALRQPGHPAGLDHIDLGAAGSQSLSLTLADVLDLTGRSAVGAAGVSAANGWQVSGASGVEPAAAAHQIVIDGHAGDSVVLGGGWTPGPQMTHDAHTYQSYVGGSGSSLAQLLIDVDMQRLVA